MRRTASREVRTAAPRHTRTCWTILYYPTCQASPTHLPLHPPTNRPTHLPSIHRSLHRPTNMDGNFPCTETADERLSTKPHLWVECGDDELGERRRIVGLLAQHLGHGGAVLRDERQNRESDTKLAWLRSIWATVVLYCSTGGETGNVHIRQSTANRHDRNVYDCSRDGDCLAQHLSHGGAVTAGRKVR